MQRARQTSQIVIAKNTCVADVMSADLGGLRAGSPPSPPPGLIRPTVRRLPRSPRLIWVPIVSKFLNSLFFRLVWPVRRRRRSRQARHDSTKFVEDVSVVLFEIAIDPVIREQAFDVAACDNQT